jgi:hypothetical protein
MNKLTIIYAGVEKKYPYLINKNGSFDEKIEESLKKNDNIDIVKYTTEFLNLLNIRKEELNTLKILKIKRNKYFENVSVWIWKNDVRKCLDHIFNRLTTLIYKMCFNDFMCFHYKDIQKEFKLDELFKTDLPGINMLKLNKYNTGNITKSVLFYDKLISTMIVLDEDETFFDIIDDEDRNMIISKKIDYNKFLSLIKNEFFKNKDNKEFICIFKSLNFGKYYLNLLKKIIESEIFIEFNEMNSDNYYRGFLKNLFEKEMFKKKMKDEIN